MKGKIQSLLGKGTTPLSQEDSQAFISLCLSESKPETLQGMDKDIRESQNFGYMVLTSRLESFKANFSPTLDIGLGPQIFCSIISRSPGNCVMWAYALNEMFNKYKKQITMTEFAKEFPMGIPSEKEYGEVWDAQKKKPPYSGGDNMIDDFENWGTPD